MKTKTVNAKPSISLSFSVRRRTKSHQLQCPYLSGEHSFVVVVVSILFWTQTTTQKHPTIIHQLLSSSSSLSSFSIALLLLLLLRFRKKTRRERRKKKTFGVREGSSSNTQQCQSNQGEHIIARFTSSSLLHRPLSHSLTFVLPSIFSIDCMG